MDEIIPLHLLRQEHLEHSAIYAYDAETRESVLVWNSGQMAAIMGPGVKIPRVTVLGIHVSSITEDEIKAIKARISQLDPQGEKRLVKSP